MAFHYRDILFRLRSDFRGRAKEISRNSPERKSTCWREISGAALALAALFLGVYANQWSEIEAISNWKKTHLPSFQLVGVLLHSQGLILDEKNVLTNNVKRLLADRKTSAGLFLLSRDASAVAFDPGKSLGEVLVYRTLQNESRDDWRAVGSGYEGLEFCLNQLVHKTKPAIFRSLKKKGPPLRDPREVFFK